MTETSDNTGTGTATAQAAVTFPSEVDVYDALMGKIELDLVSVCIPRLGEKYVNETPDQRQSRFKRYETAFAKFDEAFHAWNADMQLAVSSLRHAALGSAERESRKEEENVLSGIESQFGTC